MLRNVNSITNLVDTYIEKCTRKINYHERNAKSSKLWEDTFRVCKVIVSSASALTMTCLAVYNVENYVIAITGGSFIFVTGIIDKLQEMYNFGNISFKHNLACDEYKTICYRLELNKALENNNTDINSMVESYLAIEDKWIGIQPVRNCFLGCFFD